MVFKGVCSSGSLKIYLLHSMYCTEHDEEILGFICCYEDQFVVFSLVHYQGWFNMNINWMQRYMTLLGFFFYVSKTFVTDMDKHENAL
jgi:hypothetical protein